MLPSLAVVPLVKSTFPLHSEAGLPSTAITKAAPKAASSTIAVTSPPRTKLSRWWEQHREEIMASIITVFQVTSNVLKLVPLAGEQAANAVEMALSTLEKVQVIMFFFGGSSPALCSDERTNTLGRLGERRRRPQLDPADGTHHARSSTIRAGGTAGHGRANREVAGVSASLLMLGCDLIIPGSSPVSTLSGVKVSRSRG
jgi:hypothetical protein